MNRYVKNLAKAVVPVPARNRIREFYWWLKSAPVLPLKTYSVPYNLPTHTYKKLVCLTGFGHSGSGAVLDYLSEFDNCTVLGAHDVGNGSGFADIKSVNFEEFNFLRCVGGIMDLEKAFDNNGYFQQDYAVKLFLHVAEYFYRRGGIYTDKFWDLTNQFINEIIDYKLPTSYGFEGLYMFDFKSDWKKYDNLSSPLCCKNIEQKDKYLYTLKNLTKNEYRGFAKDYIVSFLNTIESKELLILDQAVSTSKSDMERKIDYLGDFKLLCSYRDPRDVYVTGIRTNSNWIPRAPEIFVKWYLGNSLQSYMDEMHPNKLIIRFEDFVFDYNSTATRINKFLGFNDSSHIHKKEYFNPEISKKNIGIYKDFEDQNAIKYIENKLKQYCYEETL